MTEISDRVFSGIQPTGTLHIGNYLGAMKRFVELQKSYNCIYCVVDLHAITDQVQEPQKLAHNTRKVTAAFLACGIDPQKHILFNQSRVQEHLELAWIFNCVARMSWLSRMTQFKEKSRKKQEGISVGLLIYPTLMVSDILTYRATHVPVGEDQKQHLELTRDIAQKFNNDYCEHINHLGLGQPFQVGDEIVNGYFPLIKPMIGRRGSKVMSLRDGTQKMSKSDPSDFSRILMTDDEDTIEKKIRKAKTDMDGLPGELIGLKGRPEAKNLVELYAALADTTRIEVLKQFAGSHFSRFKPVLVELIVEKIGPIAKEIRRLQQESTEIDKILINGAERARGLAKETLADVKEIVGFVGARD
ncbi:tryptophan--tRNA ligase [Candidatus Endowatersipora endosymbiont of Watersipora subatra]|uniref:tryptophan--tRNA ligase n=1 Tax=Candidatus Endowatersipora endosymbiont of Watersipora subatra TaxID=3077946 RepID=UPI00312C9C48